MRRSLSQPPAHVGEVSAGREAAGRVGDIGGAGRGQRGGGDRDGGQGQTDGQEGGAAVHPADGQDCRREDMWRGREGCLSTCPLSPPQQRRQWMEAAWAGRQQGRVLPGDSDEWCGEGSGEEVGWGEREAEDGDGSSAKQERREGGVMGWRWRWRGRACVHERRRRKTGGRRGDGGVAAHWVTFPLSAVVRAWSGGDVTGDLWVGVLAGGCEGGEREACQRERGEVEWSGWRHWRARVRCGGDEVRQTDRDRRWTQRPPNTQREPLLDSKGPLSLPSPLIAFTSPPPLAPLPPHLTLASAVIPHAPPTRCPLTLPFTPLSFPSLPSLSSLSSLPPYSPLHVRLLSVSALLLLFCLAARRCAAVWSCPSFPQRAERRGLSHSTSALRCLSCSAVIA